MVAASIKFDSKISIGFCRSAGKRFFLEVSCQSQQKEHRVLSKNSSGDFQNSPQFEKSAVFM